MKFNIQKFGGTSVASPSLREKVIAKVIKSHQEGYSPVVVVSAMGRRGDPYATDTLINFVKEIHQSIPPRELDMLMGCGEIISGVTMVNTLNKHGYRSVFLTGGQGGIITDNNYNDARIIEVNPQNIVKYAEEGYIVVVAGFQGITREGDITTLGRGGSDTTAAALGAALHAESIEIYTDVDGIMTADPRIVKNARTLDVVTYNEIRHLAYEGAKVIHPRAVEIAMQHNIPLRVKCTFSDDPGTLVISNNELSKYDIIHHRPITGITHIPNLTQIKVFTKDYPHIENVQLKIFKAIYMANISVDFINIHPHAVIFTVKDFIGDTVIQILEKIGIKAEVIINCAKIAAVGAGMTGVPGVMANIIEALTKVDVQVLQSADSYTTIWCLVKNDDMEKAVQALHEHFKLNL